MVRTVISLDEDDKRWLDRLAEREGVPMTELVRRAVRLYRRQAPTEGRSLDELLQVTSGLWKRGDGLQYQRRLRRES
jgi:hypothetical protein